MRVMVVGGGGREHCIAWKVRQSPMVDELFCVPGNGGTARIGKNLPGDPSDVQGLVALAREHRIDFTIVGPEVPLALGVVDAFEAQGLPVFGPCAEAAKIEASKAFSKEFMVRHRIRTGEFEVFEDAQAARDYVGSVGLPVVIKADGLAFGKGSFVCRSDADVEHALRQTLIDHKLGVAGKRIVVEEYLEGQEASFVVITDGQEAVALPSSEDHKQLLDGDKGPNTGGMGAFSPTDVVDDRLAEKVLHEVMMPAISGLRQEGRSYRGALYAGLMLVEGEVYVLEFNCRFGDPETQATFPRIKGDIMPVLMAAAAGSLSGQRVEVSNDHCVCVVLASQGYPGKYEKGFEVFGLQDAERQGEVFVFHAGTKLEGQRVVTSGGRVLA